MNSAQVSAIGNFWNSPQLGQVIACVATAVLLLLALYPICRYLRHGWTTKKNDIVNTFSVEAMELYLKEFKQKDLKGQAAEDEFDDIYNDSFGRYRYIIPLILFVIVCAFGLFFSCEWAVTHLLIIGGGTVSTFGKLSTTRFISLPAIGAIAEVGAFVWIVSDFFDRSQRQNLQPTDVLNSALRLALAGPIGYAFSAIGAGGVLAPVLAFSAGAFPLTTVRVILRRFATKQLGLGLGIDDDEDDQVIELNGIDHPTADLLLDAGVPTVAQLAFCDPVQLCMRTGLSFDYVVDIVSEARAWLYFEQKLDILRPAGLRGVLEINNMLEDLKGNLDSPETKKAAALSDVASQMVNLSPAAFLNACEECAGDSGAIFLVAVWRMSGVVLSEAPSSDDTQSAEKTDA